MSCVFVYVNWYKGGLINRVMDATITNDAYTFANVRITDPIRLLTIKGGRATYTPVSTPDQSMLDMIQENIPGARVLYPECCSQLLSHLIQKRKGGQRLLDTAPYNCEFAIASNTLKNVSYTGVDPREELKAITEGVGVDTDRIMFVPSIADSGEEPYDIMIVDLKDITTISRKKLKDDGIVIIRGTEETRSSATFGNCWALPFPNIYGTVGIRNTENSCDALFIVSNQKDGIDLPEPTEGKVSYIHKLPKDIFPEPPFKSTVSYGGKKVPYLGGHAFACLQYTTGITQNTGIILQASTYNPIEYLSLYSKSFIGRGGKINLHIFEYNSKIPNRSYVYSQESINMIVHTHTSYNKCKDRASYVINDTRDIISPENDNNIVDLIADGIVRVMGVEDYPLIELRGVYDLLSKGVAKAYPRSDIRIAMDSCDPSTLTYIQSTRDGSKMYATSTIGRKVPSMVVEPETTDYPIGEYTKEEMLVLVETNLPQYSRPGKDDYGPTSPDTSLPPDSDIKTPPHVIAKDDSDNHEYEPLPLRMIPDEEYFSVGVKDV